jgi:DNA-binding GntR family transcriptional regulator
MNVTPLRRPTAGSLVAADIRRRIFAGELRGDERLNQVELAEALGVSRIPVREALFELARDGVVRMEPHRGAFVEPLSERSVRDHYELFGVVDGFALGKALERADDDELAGLAALMARTRRITEPAEMTRTMQAVRSEIHRLGGSARFRAVARGLVGIVPGDFFAEVPGSLAVTRRLVPRMAKQVGERSNDAIDSYVELLDLHGSHVVDLLRRHHALAVSVDAIPAH